MLVEMKLPDACRKASELNRAEEAGGTATRYVVVAHPIGSCGGDYQVVSRRVRGAAHPRAPR
jgi:hypothetical protein